MNRPNTTVRIARGIAAPIILMLLIFIIAPAPIVHAATITVNDTGGGAGGGTCTLRDAINAANTNAVPPGTNCVAGSGSSDTIELPSGATITLSAVDNGAGTVEATGLPIIITNITINGHNSTIQRAGAAPYFRIFKIGGSGGSLILNDISITNGRTPDSGSGVGGMGGAISNYGTLTVNNSTITGNVTGDGSTTGGLGGGIASTYVMTITNSTITGNTTGTGTLNEGGDGGGIYNSGRITIQSSTISNNAIGTGNGGGFGGAIYNHNSTIVNISDSTISNNLAGNGTLGGGSGGAIYNNLGVTANITNCTISGNTAGNATTSGEGGYGGGIYQGSGTLTIASTTLSGNTTGNGSSSGGHGGAIYNASGTTNLTNVTLSGNSTGTPSGSGGGIRSEGTLNVTSSTIANNTAVWTGGGLFINNGTATVKNTIVANNTGSPSGNCAGIVATNGGNNLDSGTTCGWGSTNGSMSSTNPLLGALANNGSTRQTLALQINSPAIDGVTYNSPNGSPATDARGATRPKSTRYDIGAYEASIITVNSNSGSYGGSACTLRDAIASANTDSVYGGCVAGFGPDIIILPTGVTITLSDVYAGSGIDTNGLPLVTSNITISGNNSIIERSSGGATPAFRIFSVDTTGILALYNVTVRNGKTPDGTMPGMLGGFGGGISSTGALYVINSTISGNRTGNGNGGGTGGSGAGIYIGSGTATISSTTISGNTAGNSPSGSGGGGGGLLSQGTLNMTNCTVTGNATGTPNGVGGGLQIGSGLTANVTSSTIVSNTSTMSGGGIRTGGAATTLRNTIVANNIAPSNANCDNTVTNGGNNLDSGTSCSWGSSNGSMSNTNPLIGPLANNGGPTLTMALPSGSPAVNGVTYLPPNGSPSVDQRGYARPYGIRHDIGAFEYFPLNYYYLPYIKKSP